MDKILVSVRVKHAEFALIVQWIELWFPEPEMEVRIPLGAPANSYS